MEPELSKSPRNSKMLLGEVYFWTNTIKDWKKLLQPDKYKHIIVQQLQWLVQHEKIELYGYVIMPNHLHFIWKMRQKNGKEMQHASFNKWTSSNFLKDLQLHHPQVLPYLEEKTKERNFRFWQRDPLAVLLDSKEKLEQKLNYLHTNPLQAHWNLAPSLESYRWSSAGFYLTGHDEFGILTHYLDRF